MNQYLFDSIKLLQKIANTQDPERLPLRYAEYTGFASVVIEVLSSKLESSKKENEELRSKLEFERNLQREAESLTLDPLPKVVEPNPVQEEEDNVPF